MACGVQPGADSTNPEIVRPMRLPFRPCLLAAALGAILGPVHAQEALDTIRVESTTIDDRFDDKRAEPSAVGVISGDQVDAAHTENIQQLLQSVPGVTTEFDSGDTLKIHFRGVENQVYMGEKPGVAVVIDGVPVFERTGKVNIDLDNIESIKVLKGGASYLFGDDALAGAVIITTKRGAKRAGYIVGGEYGSFGYWKGLASAGFSNEQANGHVQVSRRGADGYYDDSAYRADYVDGKLQYYITDKSDLTFGFENSKRQKNSHGSVSGATAAEEDPKSEDPAYNDYASRFDVNLAKYYLTYAMDVAENTNWMVNGYQFGDATQFSSSPIEGTDNYNYFNDYKQTQRGVKTEFRSGNEQFGWMAAAEVRNNTYLNKVKFDDCTDLGAWAGCTVGATKSSSDTSEKVQAAYGELKYRVATPFIVTMNGRYDQIALDYKDKLDSTLSDDKEFAVQSYRLGGNYAAADNLDFYANVSTGFRAPSAEQLFVGNSNPTSSVAANPDLKPEFSLNKEIGMRNRTAWFDVPVEMDLALFELTRTDHIQPTAGQYTTDPAADNVYDNVGDMRNRGLELALSSDPQREWFWNVGYTYIDAKYTKYDHYNLRTTAVGGVCPAGSTPGPASGWPPTVENCFTDMDLAGNDVPRVPAHHLNAALHYRPSERWLITGEMDAVSDYFADEANIVKVDGHETYNLLVNYDIPAYGAKWALFARVDNLLDDHYYNTARGSNDGNGDGVFNEEDISIVVNQGRTYTVGVSAAF
jgi:iron complex outermembrane receptor protein